MLHKAFAGSHKERSNSHTPPGSPGHGPKSRRPSPSPRNTANLKNTAKSPPSPLGSKRRDTERIIRRRYSLELNALSNHAQRKKLNEGSRPLNKIVKKKSSATDLFGKAISPRKNTKALHEEKVLLELVKDGDLGLETEKEQDLDLETTNLSDSSSSNSSSEEFGSSDDYTSEEDVGHMTSDITRRIRLRNKFKSDSNPHIIKLPRGGVYIETRIGAIQVGMPPETIKDSMNMGMKIPTIYVIPQERFHRWRMISVAEFEFPAYFNFFVLQNRVRLVCTKGAEVNLRAAFQESLLGPVDLSTDSIADDFDPNLPLELRPDINAERNFFGTNSIDKLIEFVTLKEVCITRSAIANNDLSAPTSSASSPTSYLEADLGQGIFVRLEASLGEDQYAIIDTNLSDRVPATRTQRSFSGDLSEYPAAPAHRNAQRRNSFSGGTDLRNQASVVARVPGAVELPNFRTFALLEKHVEPFTPPDFGVTFLGTSHGFDPSSSTTGFVVWINGVGLLVDPPPNSAPVLELMGIPPRLIRNVLVTHCHADHDAGTMQKIMLDENVTVVATPTIINSFLRKYSNLTSMPIEAIKKRFNIRYARVGQWMNIFGGEIRLFYAFHTIPCCGFVVRFGGKSICYSADTYYDPARINELREKGILSRLRAEALLNFPFSSDLVLHECGVPPIHTPLTCLQKLSEEERSRLYLVHVTASSVPADCGLNLAKEGVENTLVLDVSGQIPQLANAITTIGWIRDAAPLRDLSLDQLHDLMSVTRILDFHRNECITDQVLNDSFVVLGSGSADLYESKHDKQGDTSTLLQGDCLFIGGKQYLDPTDRPKIIVTTETCRAALFQVADVNCFARQDGGTYDLVMRWKQENVLRERFSAISVLDCLTMRQRALFASLFHPTTFQPGQVLWSKGQQVEYAFVIASGDIEIERRHDSGLDSDQKRSRGPNFTRASASSATSVYDAQQNKEAQQQFSLHKRNIEEYDQDFLDQSTELHSRPRNFSSALDAQAFGGRRKDKDELPTLFLCDLPAMYHRLPHTSELRVASHSTQEATGYKVTSQDLLSFLRATPHLLYRMHASFSQQNHAV